MSIIDDVRTIKGLLCDYTNSDSGSFVDMTAPGETAVVTGSYSSGSTQFTVANINTNVVVRLEGSLDGVTYFNLNSTDTTITANGTYALSWSDVYAEYVKFAFVSEAGGTDATISDFSYKFNA